MGGLEAEQALRTKLIDEEHKKISDSVNGLNELRWSKQLSNRLNAIVTSIGSEDRSSNPEVTDVPKSLISVDRYSSDSESSSDDDEPKERPLYVQEVLQPETVDRKPRCRNSATTEAESCAGDEHEDDGETNTADGGRLVEAVVGPSDGQSPLIDVGCNEDDGRFVEAVVGSTDGWLSPTDVSCNEDGGQSVEVVVSPFDGWSPPTNDGFATAAVESRCHVVAVERFHRTSDNEKTIERDDPMLTESSEDRERSPYLNIDDFSGDGCAGTFGPDDVGYHQESRAGHHHDDMVVGLTASVSSPGDFEIIGTGLEVPAATDGYDEFNDSHSVGTIDSFHSFDNETVVEPIPKTLQTRLPFKSCCII